MEANGDETTKFMNINLKPKNLQITYEPNTTNIIDNEPRLYICVHGTSGAAVLGGSSALRVRYYDG